MSQWVRHVSGQGEKWKVVRFPQDYDHDEMERADQWKVENDKPGAPSFYHYLPRSEYVICDPPEHWIDVTADCEAQRNGQGVLELWHYQHGNRTDPALVNLDYRVRKVLVSLRIGDFAASAATGQQGWAFLIERRIP